MLKLGVRDENCFDKELSLEYHRKCGWDVIEGQVDMVSKMVRFNAWSAALLLLWLNELNRAERSLLR